MINAIAGCGILPVVKINDASNAVPLAHALLAGGIDVIEITFRTPAAAGAIANIVREVPEMLVGAGTVLSLHQLASAKRAGARFIVSPGLDAEIIRSAQADGLVIIPGAVTPTEICAALNLGLTVVKFFPAQIYGGAAAIRALAAPFKDVKFVPTGGINQENVQEYWTTPQVLAVGGSWMVDERLIDAGEFQTIEALTAEAVSLRKECMSC